MTQLISFTSPSRKYPRQVCIRPNIYFDIVIKKHFISTSCQKLCTWQIGKEYFRSSRKCLFWRPIVDIEFHWEQSFSAETCVLHTGTIITHSLGVLTGMSHYTTVWWNWRFSVLNITCRWFNRSSALCVTVPLYHQPNCIWQISCQSQSGWWQASLSSCRLHLLLWHLLGWAPPASPPGRSAVLRHHRCRSPLGSLTHLKTKNQNLLTMQHIIYNKLCDIRSIGNSEA